MCTELNCTERSGTNSTTCLLTSSRREQEVKLIQAALDRVQDEIEANAKGVRSEIDALKEKQSKMQTQLARLGTSTRPWLPVCSKP